MLVGEELTTETNCNLTTKAFTVALTSTTFELLTDGLYKNPALAIVRELLTNAYDAQKSIGKEDIPIDVHFPNTLEPVFSIRDYGPGLSEEDIDEVYTTFFISTKSNNNDYTGGFGLGSKTPFAYTSSFIVISYYEGNKYTYLASKINGIPSIIKTSVESYNGDSGLEVRINCNRNNPFSEFRENAKSYLWYIPEIKISSKEQIERADKYFNYKNMTFYESNNTYHYYWRRYHNIKFKQGQNVYSLNEDIIDNLDAFKTILEKKDEIFSRVISGTVLVVEVPIGTLDIPPSREELRVTDENIKIIDDLLVEAFNTFKVNQKKILPNIKNIVDDSLYKDIFVDPVNEKVITDLNSDTWLYVSQSHKFGRYLYANTRVYGRDYTDNNSIGKISLNNYRKQYVLYVDSISKYGGYSALDIVRANYEELQNVDIHLAYINDYTTNYYNNSSILCAVRQAKNTFFILNSLEDEMAFDIEDMSIKTFYKKFPRLLDKEQKKVELDECKVNEPVTKQIYIKQCTFDFTDTYRGCKVSLWANGENTKADKDKIKDGVYVARCEKEGYECVFVTMNGEPIAKGKTFYYQFNSLQEIITDLCNTKKVLQGFQKFLDTDKEKFILSTSGKTNTKLFNKHFKHIDIEDIKDIIFNSILPLHTYESNDSWSFDSNSTMGRTVLDIDRIIDNQPKKVAAIIKNTRWYKKHLVIKQYISKVSKYNYSTGHIISEAKAFLGDKYTLHFEEVPRVTRFISKRTKDGYDMLLTSRGRRGIKDTLINVLNILK